METKRRRETLSFQEAATEIGRIRVRETPTGRHRVFSYVERGFYANQIERLLKYFPREQLFFVRTDRLWHREMQGFYTVGIVPKGSPLFGLSFRAGIYRPSGESPRRRQILTRPKNSCGDLLGRYCPYRGTNWLGPVGLGAI